MPDNNKQFYEAVKTIWVKALRDSNLDAVVVRHLMGLYGYYAFSRLFDLYREYYDCHGPVYDLECPQLHNGTDPLSPDTPFTPQEVPLWLNDNSHVINEDAVVGFASIGVEVLWVPLVFVMPQPLALSFRFIQHGLAELYNRCYHGRDPLAREVAEAYPEPEPRTRDTHSFRQYLTDIEPTIVTITYSLMGLVSFASLPAFKHFLNEAERSVDCPESSWSDIYFYGHHQECSGVNATKAQTAAFAQIWLRLMATYAISKHTMMTVTMAAFHGRRQLADYGDQCVNRITDRAQQWGLNLTNLKRRREVASWMINNTTKALLILAPLWGFAINAGIKRAQTVWEWGFCQGNIFKMATHSSPWFNDATTQAIPDLHETLPEPWEDYIQKMNASVTLPACGFQSMSLGYAALTMSQEVIPFHAWVMPIATLSILGAALYGCVTARPDSAEQTRTSVDDESLEPRETPYSRRLQVLQNVNQNLDNHYVNPIKSSMVGSFTLTILGVLSLISFGWVHQILNESKCDSGIAKNGFDLATGNCGAVSLMRATSALGSISWSMSSTVAFTVGSFISLMMTLKLLSDNLRQTPQYEPIEQRPDEDSSRSRAFSSDSGTSVTSCDASLYTKEPTNKGSLNNPFEGEHDLSHTNGHYEKLDGPLSPK